MGLRCGRAHYRGTAACISGKSYAARADAFPVRPPLVLVEILTRLLKALLSEPHPRTYDGNPSAGAEPSTAETDYQVAKEIAHYNPDAIKFFKWRW